MFCRSSPLGCCMSATLITNPFNSHHSSVMSTFATFLAVQAEEAVEWYIAEHLPPTVRWLMYSGPYVEQHSDDEPVNFTTKPSNNVSCLRNKNGSGMSVTSEVKAFGLQVIAYSLVPGSWLEQFSYFHDSMSSDNDCSPWPSLPRTRNALSAKSRCHVISMVGAVVFACFTFTPETH